MLPNNPLDRRDFLKLGATGLAAAGLPALSGCVQDPTTLPPLALAPNPANARNQVFSHSVHIPVREERVSDLLALLDRGKLFAKRAPGVHFARVAYVDAEHLGRPKDQPGELTVGIIYDRRIETALNFITENGATLDAVLQCCAGYRAGWAENPVRLHEYLARFLVEDKLFFPAYDTAENEVLACVAVQDNFLELLRRADSADDDQLPYLVDRFLLGGISKTRATDAPRRKLRGDHLPFAPHLTNTLTMVQPLMKGPLDPSQLVPCSRARLERMLRFVGKHFSYRQAFEFILSEGEFAVKQLHEHPLADLHTLHFARIALIDDDRMLFSSVYDGDFTQYVLDFGSRVADQIDFIWGLTQHYPPAGCRDVPGFIAWIRRGQVDVEDFYSAEGNLTLLEIQRASKLLEKLAKFTQRMPAQGPALRARLRAFVRENQALLG